MHSRCRPEESSGIWVTEVMEALILKISRYQLQVQVDTVGPRKTHLQSGLRALFSLLAMRGAQLLLISKLIFRTYTHNDETSRILGFHFFLFYNASLHLWGKYIKIIHTFFASYDEKKDDFPQCFSLTFSHAIR